MRARSTESTCFIYYYEVWPRLLHGPCVLKGRAREIEVVRAFLRRGVCKMRSGSDSSGCVGPGVPVCVISEMPMCNRLPVYM